MASEHSNKSDNYIKKRLTGIIAGVLIAAVITGTIMIVRALSGDNQNDDGTQQVSSAEIGTSDSTTINVYYLNKGITAIVPVTHTPEAKDTGALIDELIEQLSKVQDKVEYVSPIEGFTLLGKDINSGSLTLNFSTAYSSLNKVREVLTRAAIVDTLCQVDGVKTISFQIDGAPLTDSSDSPVGAMTKDTFVFNLGKDINLYEKDSLRLYFADATGKKLVAVSRPVIYNSNISKEKLIVEELLKGPNGTDIYPIINPDTTILSVTSRDGVCFVSFDKYFMTEPYAVSAEVVIYSIVDSLTELPDIQKVQISVDSDTSGTFMESMPLQNIYTRDLTLVEGNNE
ncbi:MAG: GerMN domain-containing protein [Lachnospiraceae bacterium]|nr:GerMN domain-containing protein [Lachnospiraceae bacterium]MDD4525104.1 GerMN domain-containing protein [Lachnospiraceae bacterium]